MQKCPGRAQLINGYADAIGAKDKESARRISSQTEAKAGHSTKYTL
jgi:hypothetical protein